MSESEPTKVCTACEASKPIESFYVKDRKNGRRSSRCKQCHRDGRNPVVRDIPQKDTKVCTRCHIEKPLCDFHKSKNEKDGRQFRCKQCTKEYNARPEIAERRHRVQKIYNSTIRGKIIAREGWRRYESTEAAKEKRRQRRKGEKHKAGCRQYDLVNHEKRRAHRAVKEAINKGLMPRARNNKCASCGLRQASHYHHHRGYDREHWLDVVPLCNRCHGSEHSKYTLPELEYKDGKRTPVLLDELGILIGTTALP